MTAEKIIDFEKESVKLESNELQKLIDENGLHGFFKDFKAPPPTGIVFHYDVEEVKNKKNEPVENQKG